MKTTDELVKGYLEYNGDYRDICSYQMNGKYLVINYLDANNDQEFYKLMDYLTFIYNSKK